MPRKKRSDRQALLDSVAEGISGWEMFQLLATADQKERDRFWKVLHESAIGSWLIRQALDDPQSGLTDIVFAHFGRQLVRKHPQPEMVSLRAQMWLLRQQDPNRWTWGKLAQKFKISRETARKRVKDFVEKDRVKYNIELTVEGVRDWLQRNGLEGGGTD